MRDQYRTLKVANKPSVALPDDAVQTAGLAPVDRGASLRDYAGVFWRRKWIIVATMVICIAAGVAYASSQTKMYQATATMIYENNIDLSSPLTGKAYTDTLSLNRDISSIVDIMGSPDMRGAAGKELAAEGADPNAKYTISATAKKEATSNSDLVGSNVILVTAKSASPKLSMTAANVYAATFVETRKRQQRAQIAKAAQFIRDQLANYQGLAKESAEYVVWNQRLEDLQVLYATATGNFRVLVPAKLPTGPYAPVPLHTALVGLGIGLLLGIAIAFAVDQLDTRLRRPEDVAAVLNQPILGRVPPISAKLLGESSLVAMKEPHGHIAESFRMVRTNLEFLGVDNDIGSLMVTSCAQGEGKSVCVANLAISLALAGKKVVIVDADLRRPRQHMLFGLSNEAGLSTVATGRHTLTEAMVPIEVAPNTSDDPSEGLGTGRYEDWVTGPDSRLKLYVLPSGPIPPNPGEIVSSQRFEDIVDILEAEADLVIVDTPAMLAVGDSQAIASKVDGLVFLVDLKNTNRPLLQTAAETLRRLPVMMLGTIVRVHSRGSSSRYSGTSPYYYNYTYADGRPKTRSSRRHKKEPEAPQPAAATSSAGGSGKPPQPLG